MRKAVFDHNELAIANPAPNTTRQRVAATRHAASNATDADDLAVLLDMLGLDPAEAVS